MATHLIDLALAHRETAPGATGRVDMGGAWDAVAQAAAELTGARAARLVVSGDQGRTNATIGRWARDGGSGDADEPLAWAMLSPPLVSTFDQPTGIVGGGDARLAITLDGGAGAPACLVLDFDDGAARRGAAAAIKSVATLIDRMIALDTRLSVAEAQRAAANAALDQDRCGVIAVTADARPVLTNAEAAAMLAAGDIVQLAHGTVRPMHYPDIVRFHAALDAVVRHAGQRHRARGDAVILLLRGRGRAAPMVVAITPGAAAAVQDGDARVAAIIRLFRPGVSTQGVDAVCQLFGLSPVEARLAEQLYRGRTTAEAAAALQIKVDTARSYLKQIFAKTETHRQTDLIALFNQYCFIVRGNYDYASL